MTIQNFLSKSTSKQGATKGEKMTEKLKKFIDGMLNIAEAIASLTGTEIDDKVVKALQKAFEEFTKK